MKKQDNATNKAITKLSSSKFNRRRFMNLTLTGSALTLANMGLVTKVFAANKTVKIGLNIPQTGDYAPWGLPGLFGCQIIADDLNAKGGVTIGKDKYKIEVIGYDHAYNTEKALQGFKKLAYGDKVKIVMMLGGSTVAAVLPSSTRRKVLTSTLLPSDITKKSRYLVAPCETHPLYNVTGVVWLAKNFPKAKTAVICTTNDIEYGKQSAATYQAAFEVAGIKVLKTQFHGFDVTDFAPIVRSLLATKPDIFCMATDVYTTPLVEQLYQQGFKGKIISCTLDGYQDVIAKTSTKFVEGLVFQFPDFDDPALTPDKVTFPNPKEFFATFNERHSGQWSAVAWEYPSILLSWIEAAKKAGSVEPSKVLKAMLSGEASHTFGKAKWWGKKLWGRDQALVGDWPVVVIKNGKARIQEYLSVYDWVEENTDVLIKYMKKNDIRTV